MIVQGAISNGADEDRLEERLTAYVGRRMLRHEDERFVRGAGRFVSDHHEAAVLHAAVLRSPIASGRVARIGLQRALAIPGVAAILTADDLARDGLGGIPWEICPPGLEQRARFTGDPEIAAPQPLLAGGQLRYVGEPVAFVLAETPATALDALETIELEIVSTAPVLHVEGNAPLFSHEYGTKAAVDEILAKRPHTVEWHTHIPRLVAAPLETRSYLAVYDGPQEQWTLFASAGKPHPLRDTLAKFVLHVEADRIRVVAPDIGGGFGSKNVAHAEAALCLWAAKRLGRPVRWVCGRVEAFLSDMQGRDHTVSGTLAFDADGRFLAYRYESRVNLGAYLGPRGISPCLNGIKVLTGPYHIGSAHARVSGYLTNTVPTCPYRGAGVPETAFMLERLVDMAARRLGLDPADLRRRNLVRPEQLPWRNAIGLKMHSVNFPAVLDLALERSHWPAQKTSGRNRRILRGRGIAFTIEGYDSTFDEMAELVLADTGWVQIRIGTKSGGQSHETTYVQVAADALQLPPERISVLQGDTGAISRGNGTGASRSLTTGGSAILRTCEALLEEARAIAASCLQCAPEQLVYREGRFERTGPLSGSIDLAGVAAATSERRLHVTRSFRPDLFTFPGGCHVAVVEVDVETGAIDVVDYHVVHDAGTAVNPAVVEGQLQGAVVQGIGAALGERMVFDRDTGQAVSASFQDYAMPRAGGMCSIDVGLYGVPCASNPLGAKPAGEAGTVAAPAAIINAIADALGVDNVHLPATPEQIWQLLGRP